MKKILFISHEASRSGAPLALLYLLRWIKDHTTYEFTLLLMNDGPLKEDFSAVCKVIQGWRGKSGLHRKMMALAPDLVFANTIASGKLLDRMAPFHCPVITYVHELEYAIALLNTYFLSAVKHSDQFIAVSNSVRDNLVNNHGVTEKHIDVVYPIFREPKPSSSPTEARLKILGLNGISSDALVVGSVGAVEFRKGPDLFVQLAKSLRDSSPHLGVHFIWVGGFPDKDLHLSVIESVRDAGLDTQVHFVGSQADPSDYFAAFDLFVLTSREDPFPAVCLEAAALSKPIVCFNRGTGITEFVQKGCGRSVNYLDVQALSQASQELLEDKVLRQTMGTKARQLAFADHTPEVIYPQIVRIVEDALATWAVNRPKKKSLLSRLLSRF